MTRDAESAANESCAPGLWYFGLREAQSVKGVKAAEERAENAAGAIGRRAFLGGLAGGTGLLLAGGVPRWLGARPFAELDGGESLARLRASLSPAQWQRLHLPWDHPSRQLTNTVALFKGPHLGSLLDAEQLAMVEQLYATMVSAEGHRAFANTVGLEGRLPGCVLTIYGDPAQAGPSQAMIHGGHILIRGGGAKAEAEGAALGGAIAYGQQIGNGRFKVEGNAFAFHSDAANRFYAALEESERARARVESPPHELTVQIQSAGGRFAGVRVAETGEAAQEAAGALLEAVLSIYPAQERSEALSAVEHNGGVAALHVAVYEDKGFFEDGAVYSELSAQERAVRPLPYWQVWRIEGPGTVVHFKGSPHVHAYVHIARDPARQNVGEVLAHNEALREGDALLGLLEEAMRRESGAPLAFAPDVTARFCPGEITTGSAWALDPYGNRVVTMEIAGRAMAAPLRERLESRGVEVEPERHYRVATHEYGASRADWVGQPERVEAGERFLRDAVIDTLRAEGLRSLSLSAALHGGLSGALPSNA